MWAKVARTEEGGVCAVLLCPMVQLLVVPGGGERGTSPIPVRPRKATAATAAAAGDTTTAAAASDTTTAAAAVEKWWLVVTRG